MGTAKLKFVEGAVGLQSIEVGYIIDGVSDYDDARTTMFAAASPVLGVWSPVDYRLEPLDGSDELYDGVIVYGPRTNNSPSGQNDPTYQFDLGVERTRVMTSLETVGSYGTRPPSFNRAINVQPDGTVEGTEINFPVFSWSETHYLPYSRVNRAYFATLFNTIATMNAAAFRDFQRGEVLFLGVNGQKRYSAPDWEMQFKFVASPNATNLAVGPDITVTSKLGHDYLWARYESDVQTVSSVPVYARIPKHVFVERVYQFGDFDGLKLVNPLSL